LGLLSGVAAGQALPPPNPTNINFTPSTFTVPGLASTLSTPGTMSGTFAFPWGRVYRCGGTKTLPATRHCADGTFTVGGFQAEATGCYNQAVTDTYTSGPCQACQLYFVYYGAKLVLWQRTYTVAGFSYTTKWTSFHPGPNSGGFAHYGKLRVSCITDNTCPGCGPPTGCPPGSSGDCFIPNGTPGCEDEGCCTNVCAMDPFCCDVMWGPQCADLAVVACIGEGQDVGPDVEATVPLRIDLDGFFNSDIAGTPPPGHPILDPSDSFAQLNEWHLCQIQQMCAHTSEGLEAIGEAPLSETSSISRPIPTRSARAPRTTSTTTTPSAACTARAAGRAGTMIPRSTLRSPTFRPEAPPSPRTSPGTQTWFTSSAPTTPGRGRTPRGSTSPRTSYPAAAARQPARVSCC
jgi:hypothetical protein